MSLLFSCETADILTGTAVPDKDWELIEESATNTTLNLYVTDDDEGMREWLSGYLASHLRNKYNIDLSLKILSFEDIVTTLENEVLNEVSNGSIDLLLLKDNEFSMLLDKEYLYDEITSKLPNYESNINIIESDIISEHGTPLGELGIPFGRQQLVLSFDEDALETYPVDLMALKEFLEETPQTFTYANPMTDNTGSEFLRTVLYELVGTEMDRLMNKDISLEEVETIIMPGISYLKEIDDLILKEDGKYFTKQSDIDYMYKEGQLLFSMSDRFGYINEAVNEELYPDGAKSFVFDGGSIMDTTYLAIPKNASNKTGSLIAINELISVELQLHKYLPSNFGNLPILDMNLMSEADYEQFSRASIKRNTLRTEILSGARYLELPIEVQKLINEIWDKHLNQ
jgi:putative spermidine/putrescine transport system substrate-binding protein